MEPDRTPEKTIIAIPARFGSTRFPGKPLVKIGGIPMIVRVWQQAKKCRTADRIIVATDHESIRRTIENAGGCCVMTPPELPSGTDRIAAAVSGMNAEIIVNLQGDEPLIDPESIDLTIRALENDPAADMATLATPIRHHKELMDPNIVKVVTNKNNYAMYFSRAPIPLPSPHSTDSELYGFRHIGLYAFRKSWLDRFVAAPPAKLEKIERLEQLRALYMGGLIHVSFVEHIFPGVDTPEDVAMIESLLSHLA